MVNHEKEREGEKPTPGVCSAGQAMPWAIPTRALGRAWQGVCDSGLLSHQMPE